MESTTGCNNTRCHKPHLSVAAAEMTLLQVLHSITAHMCIRWLHLPPQHRLSTLGTPRQLLKELPSSNVYRLVYS